MGITKLRVRMGRTATQLVVARACGAAWPLLKAALEEAGSWSGIKKLGSSNGNIYATRVDDDPWVLMQVRFDADNHAIEFSQHNRELQEFGLTAAKAKEIAVAATQATMWPRSLSSADRPWAR